jgi:RNA polymerase sigma-70 factor, ECF subfamily
LPATTKREESRVDAENEKVIELYKLYGPAIHRRCRRLLGDKEAGNDATQEVFIRLISNVAKLTTRDSAIRWIYRVCINHCLHVIRTAARRSDGSAHFVEEPRTNGDIDIVADRQLVEKLLSRFDSKTQAVALGVLVGGMEQEEVAELLGISSTTVGRKLRRFSVDSRKYLRRTGGLAPAEEAVPAPVRLASSG